MLSYINTKVMLLESTDNKGFKIIVNKKNKRKIKVTNR